MQFNTMLSFKTFSQTAKENCSTEDCAALKVFVPITISFVLFGFIARFVDEGQEDKFSMFSFKTDSRDDRSLDCQRTSIESEDIAPITTKLDDMNF